MDPELVIVVVTYSGMWVMHEVAVMTEVCAIVQVEVLMLAVIDLQCSCSVHGIVIVVDTTVVLVTVIFGATIVADRDS